MTNEKEIIRLALDENNKQAWKALEKMLFVFHHNRNEINQFLDGLHVVATSENYTSIKEMLDDLKENFCQR